MITFIIFFMVVLSKNITICSSFWKKGTGLMFKKQKDDFAYVFAFKKPKLLIITMVFVFFPIDILFIRDGKIIEIAKEVKPFTQYIPQQHADTFIEVPVGSLNKDMVNKKVIWNSTIVEIVDK